MCVVPKVFSFFHRGVQSDHSWPGNIGQLNRQHTGFSAAAEAASPGLEGSATASDGSNLMPITRHKVNNGS